MKIKKYGYYPSTDAAFLKPDDIDLNVNHVVLIEKVSQKSSDGQFYRLWLTNRFDVYIDQKDYIEIVKRI